MANLNISELNNSDDSIKIEKRKSYNILEKLSTIKMVENSGYNYANVSQTTGIHRKLLKEWVEDKSKFEAENVSPCRRRLDGAGRKPLNDELDQRLLSFVQQLRSKKFPVSHEMIREKAIQISIELKICDFKASHGYIHNFLKRSELVYRRPTHKSQQNNRSVNENAYLALKYLNKLNRR